MVDTVNAESLIGLFLSILDKIGQHINDYGLGTTIIIVLLALVILVVLIVLLYLSLSFVPKLFGGISNVLFKRNKQNIRDDQTDNMEYDRMSNEESLSRSRRNIAPRTLRNVNQRNDSEDEQEHEISDSAGSISEEENETDSSRGACTSNKKLKPAANVSEDENETNNVSKNGTRKRNKDVKNSLHMDMENAIIGHFQQDGTANIENLVMGNQTKKESKKRKKQK